MARVTVEDCVEKITNRFELVMIAAQRARALAGGAELTVERDNDKNGVVSLREIADGTIDLEQIETNLIQGLQRHVEFDEPEEDELEMLTSEQDLMTEIDGVFSGRDASADDLAGEDRAPATAEKSGEPSSAKAETTKAAGESDPTG